MSKVAASFVEDQVNTYVVCLISAWQVDSRFIGLDRSTRCASGRCAHLIPIWTDRRRARQYLHNESKVCFHFCVMVVVRLLQWQQRINLDRMIDKGNFGASVVQKRDIFASGRWACVGLEFGMRNTSPSVGRTSVA